MPFVSDYAEFDKAMLEAIDAGCNTAAGLTVRLDSLAKPLAPSVGDEFRVVDKRLQAMRKKGLIVWGREGRLVLWRRV